MSTTEPFRPEPTEMPVSADVEAILRERIASFEQDRKKAAPASDVFRCILQTPKP